MDIKACIYTDVGTKKNVNQDSTMIKVARTESGNRIALAVLCDGMGGLSSGEVASAAFTRRMEKWFYEELPDLLSEKNQTRELNGEERNRKSIWELVRSNWYSITQEMNINISDYGRKRNIVLGTTAIILMIVENEFMIMNVGDSRAYMNDNTNLYQITHDHSLVQQLVDRGQIKRNQAKNSKDKSVLLQCVGASEIVKPDFFKGQIGVDTMFILCSDGFWRRIEDNELLAGTRPLICCNDEIMECNLKGMSELVKRRGEEDNISVMTLKCSN